MLRSVFAPVSALQIWARLKESLERSVRKAVVIGVALVFLTEAAGIGLLAAYHALVSIYQFSTFQAAAIMAASLGLIGLIVLAIVPLIGRPPKRASPAFLVATGEGTGLIDQGLGKAIRQIGPVPLLAIAFVTGLLASRREKR